MSDSWAGVLAISVAVMALAQVALLVGLAIAARRLMSAAQSAEHRLAAVTGDLQLRAADLQQRAQTVLDRAQHATAEAQTMMNSVRDRAHRAEEAVKSAGRRVATAVDHVPPQMRTGVPVMLVALTALRGIVNWRRRMRLRRVARFAAS